MSLQVLGESDTQKVILQSFQDWKAGQMGVGGAGGGGRRGDDELSRCWKACWGEVKLDDVPGFPAWENEVHDP